MVRRHSVSVRVFAGCRSRTSPRSSGSTATGSPRWLGPLRAVVRGGADEEVVGLVRIAGGELEGLDRTGAADVDGCCAGVVMSRHLTFTDPQRNDGSSARVWLDGTRSVGGSLAAWLGEAPPPGDGGDRVTRGRISHLVVAMRLFEPDLCR